MDKISITTFLILAFLIILKYLVYNKTYILDNYLVYENGIRYPKCLFHKKRIPINRIIDVSDNNKGEARGWIIQYEDNGNINEYELLLEQNQNAKETMNMLLNRFKKVAV